MSAYRISRPAQRDLQSIDEYISADNPDAADRLLESFRSTFELLATYPASGRRRDELRPDVRSFPVGSYVVFYREVGDTIEVLRVLHGSHDIDAAF
jgi:toxin ParE1/3/4